MRFNLNRCRTVFTFLTTAFLSTGVPPLSAQTSLEEQPTRTVGSVYGKQITSADIKLIEPIDVTVKFDSRDTAKWNLMGRIMGAFGGPIEEKFLADKEVDATKTEIAAFNRGFQKRKQIMIRENESRLAKVNEDLADLGLPVEKKAQLEKERKLLEEILPSLRESANEQAKEGALDEHAKAFISSWKTERALQRAYGGRVIFQQAGLEAVGARLRLYEEAEKKGDLKFNDAGVRYMFYYYYKMQHTAIDEKKEKTILEQPWFFDDAVETPPARP